ncbi:MAG: methylenetetrahydrofolate--tRNA-(uracil(54)-C(5))-methyltransferase (FADH(2)-oxidizing) TrmFO [Bdellovibrionota bacterium]
MFSPKVQVIGAGLAGCEAAFWLAKRGIQVDLYEMRPTKMTEAHKTEALAELVCSNSFKSLSPVSAPGMLKREMEMLGSLAIASAKKAAVGAGEALAVDRDIFSAEMTAAIAAQPNIRLRREEVLALPDDPSVLTILATGPLTSSALADSLQKRTGTEHFYFYDAISPVVDAASLNMDIIFAANRYDKKTRTMEGTEVSTEDSSDYLNCPMTMQQYDAFIDLLLRGERVEGKPFEKVKHFEGCMPIEEMADRGRNTPRFGPMKPVGLVDPKTGREAFAAVQLRPENQSKSAYNLVGFQTKLKYGEQTKVFRSIPGLENAEFHRLGSMHRNSFVDAPRVLNLDLSLKEARHVMLAGQITGVEGYMESAAIGIVAGIFAEARLAQKPIPNPPEESAIGALLSHLRNSTNTNYQPMGINFSLFDDIVFTQALAPLREKFKKKLPKDEKRKALGEACAKNGAEYAARFNLS